MLMLYTVLWCYYKHWKRWKNVFFLKIPNWCSSNWEIVWPYSKLFLPPRSDLLCIGFLSNTLKLIYVIDLWLLKENKRYLTFAFITKLVTTVQILQPASQFWTWRNCCAGCYRLVSFLCVYSRCCRYSARYMAVCRSVSRVWHTESLVILWSILKLKCT